MRPNRYSLAALAGAAALAIGGGVALADHGVRGGDRSSRCEAILARIAERRGVTVAELEAQLQARLLARVDAALQAGRITAEQAAKLKQRIEEGSICGAARHARLRGTLMRAAAGYLGLTKAELRAKLPGTSLAALAQAEGKSVEDLEAAMLAPAKAKLADAVGTDRITQARADRILARLTTLVDRLVQRTLPARP